ncbi:MAG: hypothetical protein IJW70_02580 [Clostridia bacterium]|nr:hypothetical protein [Clostridia bacterium]
MAIRSKAKKLPLSGLDKMLYTFAMVLAVAFVIITLLCLGFWFPVLLARHNDPDLMASYRITDIFLSLPMIILLTFVPPYLIALGIDKRLPLFGNKSYKPKWSETVIRTTPLFSKQFFSQLTKQKKQKILTVLIILAVLFALCLSLMLPGWSYRAVLGSNGEVRQYNALNQETAQLQLADADSITIRIVERYRRFRYVWHIELEIVHKDRSYIFDQGDFYPARNTELLLRNLLEIKKMAKDKVTLENSEYISDLIKLQEYTEEEKQLLYELFAVSKAP